MTFPIFKGCFQAGLAVLLLCVILFAAVMGERFEEQVFRQLEQESVYAACGLTRDGTDFLNALETDTRLTWVSADGVVLYDSIADPAAMGNHLDREEIAEALAQGTGHSAHISQTALGKTLYYARKLPDGTVLRLSCTGATVGGMLLEVLQPALWIVLLALLLSAFFASRLARNITKPINEMDLTSPRLEAGYDELRPLISRLQEQRRTISRQMEELKRKQREFSALLENMNEGVLLLDRSGNVLSCNSSAALLLGGEAERLVRGACQEVVWTAAAEARNGRWADALLPLEGRTLQILASPVREKGYVTGAVLLTVDVTEREEREALRREFSANVSHELKTPLTAISGFAEIMKEGLVEPERMREFAGDIYQESGRLMALVEDILKLSRLEEGGAAEVRERVDLFALASEVLESLSPLAQRQNITLTLNGSPAVITGVRHILYEMLYNLCDNAIQYNREGGSVTVTVRQNGNGTEVSVQDTGVGIPKAIQSRIFERFYRAEQSHSRHLGGTGLGLSIVKHGAAQHNARILVESEPEKGTTMLLIFPQEKG